MNCMGIKKMILFIMLAIAVLFYKTLEVRAENYCYYTGNLYLKIKENNTKKAYVDRAGLRRYASNFEPVLNNSGICIVDCGFMDIQDHYANLIKNFTDDYGIKRYKGEGCPNVVVMLYGTTGAIGKKHFVYAFESEAEAEDARKQCQSIEERFIGSCAFHKGNLRPGMTEDQYQDALKIGLSDMSNNGIDISFDEWEDDQCAIFGNVLDENSLAYYIHGALSIIRILAIALLITLGTIDMAKAVIASKEDEMRKAQKTFIKRIIICIIIFLIPAIVKATMGIMDKQEWIKCSETLKY